MDPWPRVTLDKLQLRLKSGIIYLFNNFRYGELESKANQLCYDKITENFEYDTMPSSKWIVMTMILHCTAIGGRDILPFRK